MLSTGDRFTEFDLNTNNMTLIVGDNGSGKSTLLDALVFGLFGKPFRKINKGQLVNTVNRCKTLVEVEFSVGSNGYLVRRGIWPDIFEIYLNGELLDQEAKKKDTQEKLERKILKLNFKSFTQIVVLGSSSFLPFMQLSGQYRRDIIEDLLDIQIFSVMNYILKSKMSDSKKRLITYENSISVLEEKILVQKKYIKEVSEINNNQIEETQRDIKYNQELIVGMEDEKGKILEEIHGLLHHTNSIKSFKKELMDMESYKRDIKKNIARYQGDISFFNDNDNCPICKQMIIESHKYDILESTEKREQENREGLEKIVSLIEKREKVIDDIEKIQQEISEKNVEVNSIDHRILGVKDYIEKLSKKVEYLGKVKDKADGDVERLRQLVGETEETQKEKDDLSVTHKYHEIAFELLKDTGIKTNIIKQYLPIMNKMVNKYLSAMDAYFDFTLDEQFNETIRSRYRDKFSYANFSEGEKMRIDLALLFTWRAIAKMKNSASTNLLVLDEVFDSSMDTTGTDEFMKLLNTLGDKINVFVISHKGDSLLDKFDDIIRFEKLGNFSKMITNTE